MNKSAKLVLAEDGKTAHIVFANGKESDYFGSKNQVLRSIPDMIEKEKLTEDEATKIVKAVFEAENLPNRDKSEKFGLFELVTDFFINMEKISISVVEVPSPKRLLDTFPELAGGGKLNKPLFRMCSCGGPHGFIVLDKNESEFILTSFAIKSKYGGLKQIQNAEKNHGLGKEDADRLILEIEESPLPKFLDDYEEKKAQAEAK